MFDYLFRSNNGQLPDQPGTSSGWTYYTRGGFWLSLTKGITATSGFILAIALANWLPDTVFGTYQFILATTGLIGAFSLTGLNKAVIKAVAKGFDGTLIHGFWLHLKWSLGLTVILLALAGYFWFTEDFELVLIFLAIAILFPFLQSLSLFGSFLAGKRDFKTKSILTIIGGLVHTLALIVTIYLTDGLLTLILVYLLAGVLINATFFGYVMLSYKPGSNEDPELFNLSGHLSLMNVIQKIAKHLDKILIFTFLGAAELAVYAFALAPVKQLKKTNGIINDLALPHFSQSPGGGLKTALAQLLVLVLSLMAGLFVLYLFLAPYLYQWFFPEYLEAINYSRVFALSLLLAPAGLLHKALIARAQTGSLYVLETIPAGLQIILLLTLLPSFGIVGAIISLLLGQLFKLSLGYYYCYFK